MKPAHLIAIIATVGATACETKREAPKPNPAPATPSPAANAPDAAAAPVASADGTLELVLTPPAPIRAGTAATIDVAIQGGAGALVGDAGAVSDLILVSRDLTFFTRVAPEATPDGKHQASVTLPQPGPYVAFAEVRPAGGAPVTVRGAIEVAGEAPVAKPLGAGKLPARSTIDGFTVSLRSKAPLVAGTDAVLEVEVLADGKPVTDLRDLRGARGHLMMLSADTQTLHRGHPLGGTGPKVQFHAAFPSPGTYKLWAELLPQGKRVVAGFAIDVPVGAPHDHDHGGGHGHGDGQAHGHSH